MTLLPYKKWADILLLRETRKEHSHFLLISKTKVINREAV